MVTLQVGVAPMHSVLLPAEQMPHAPEGWQAGVAPPQSASAAQARHVCVPRLQTGVAPAQSALPMQRTQVPVAASQTGVSPPQRDALAAEHWPHAPDG